MGLTPALPNDDDEVDDAPPVRRIVPAGGADPLDVPRLAHGWIPSLEGIALNNDRSASRCDVAALAEPAARLNWTAPRATEPGPAMEPVMPELDGAACDGTRASDCYSPTGRDLIDFFDRVLRGEGAP